jgi:hypothetical protein
MSRTKRLRNARKKRTQASKVLAHLESGEVTLERLLDSPDHIGHVRLFTVMKRTPGLGEAGIKKCLFKAKVYPMTRLDELTESEISRVLHHLPPRVQR